MSATHKPNNGIVSTRAHKSLDDMVACLTETLHAKNIRLFAIVDHCGKAHSAGLQMRATRLLIFRQPPKPALP